MNEYRKIALDIIHGLTSADEDERERSADEITDICKSFDKFDASTIAGVLALARALEASLSCQEAEMNALAEINEYHHLDKGVIELLSKIGQENFKDSQLEYYQEIFNNAD